MTGPTESTANPLVSGARPSGSLPTRCRTSPEPAPSATTKEAHGQRQDQFVLITELPQVVSLVEVRGELLRHAFVTPAFCTPTTTPSSSRGRRVTSRMWFYGLGGTGGEARPSVRRGFGNVGAASEAPTLTPYAA